MYLHKYTQFINSNKSISNTLPYSYKPILDPARAIQPILYKTINYANLNYFHIDMLVEKYYILIYENHCLQNKN